MHRDEGIFIRTRFILMERSKAQFLWERGPPDGSMIRLLSPRFREDPTNPNQLLLRIKRADEKLLRVNTRFAPIVCIKHDAIKYHKYLHSPGYAPEMTDKSQSASDECI